jgi:hypothetical protein
LCTGSSQPEWDAGVSLCTGYTTISVFTGYCCISEGECMAALSGPLRCSGWARPYYCAGSATPPVGDSGVVCTAMDPGDGGPDLRGFCCDNSPGGGGHAADVGDTGDATDAADGE